MKIIVTQDRTHVLDEIRAAVERMNPELSARIIFAHSLEMAMEALGGKEWRKVVDDVEDVDVPGLGTETIMYVGGGMLDGDGDGGCRLAGQVYAINGGSSPRANLLLCSYSTFPHGDECLSRFGLYIPKLNDHDRSLIALVLCNARDDDTYTTLRARFPGLR